MTLLSSTMFWTRPHFIYVESELPQCKSMGRFPYVSIKETPRILCCFKKKFMMCTFFMKNNVMGISHLELLQNWFSYSYEWVLINSFSSRTEFHCSRIFKFKHFLTMSFHNDESAVGSASLAFYHWPARLPDLTVCDFFLVGVWKDPPFMCLLFQQLWVICETT